MVFRLFHHFPGEVGEHRQRHPCLFQIHRLFPDEAYALDVPDLIIRIERKFCREPLIGFHHFEDADVAVRIDVAIR